MTDAKTVAELAAKGTQGEWEAFNMTHSDGRPMTPEELGEYVTNSVKMSDETRFLFISGKAEDGIDIDVCHIGNGPKGPYNAQRIANVPAMEALIADLHDRNQKLALSEISAHGEAADIADQLAAAKARISELEAENARLKEYISKDAPRIEHLHRQSCLTLSGTQMMALDTWVGGWIYEARAALEGQGDE